MTKSKTGHDPLGGLGALDVSKEVGHAPYSARAFSDPQTLIKVRKELGVGQVELAEEAGVSQATITGIETKRNPFVDPSKAKIWRAIERLNGKWLERKKAEFVRTQQLADFQKEADRLIALQSSGALPIADTGGVSPFFATEIFSPASNTSPSTPTEQLLSACTTLMAARRTSQADLKTANETIALLVNLLNIETKKLLTEEELAIAREEITRRMHALHPDLCEEIQRKREGK